MTNTSLWPKLPHAPPKKRSPVGAAPGEVRSRSPTMFQRVTLWWIEVEGLCQKLGKLGHVGLSVLGQQVVLAGVPSYGGVLLGTRHVWSGREERGGVGVCESIILYASFFGNSNQPCAESGWNTRGS